MAKDTEPQPLQPELEAALHQLQAGQPPLEDLLCGNSGHATRLRDLQQRADAAEARIAELTEIAEARWESTKRENQRWIDAEAQVRELRAELAERKEVERLAVQSAQADRAELARVRRACADLVRRYDMGCCICIGECTFQATLADIIERGPLPDVGAAPEGK